MAGALTDNEVKTLLSRFREKKLTEGEIESLQNLLLREEYRKLVEEDISKMMAQTDQHALWTEDYAEQQWQKIKIGILDSRHSTSQLHRVHLFKTAWFRWAAIVLIILGVGTYIFLHTSSTRTGMVQIAPSNLFPDILPGSNKAILTLEDGQIIQLDTSANAQLLAQGITNDNALIVYSGKGKINTVNTLSTPNGGQYTIRLSDGTLVWLNAASSITYPTVFSGNERAVSITGEAYFEVARNKSTPFIVHTEKDSITVLGTTFNINAYLDEGTIKTSLIDGKIKVNSSILYPGSAYKVGKILPTDLSQDIAWKNGVFNFNQLTIQQAMRQLARWYDVEIVYDQLPVTAKLSGEMDRGLTLQEALMGMEGVSAKFKLAGRTVHVLPLK